MTNRLFDLDAPSEITFDPDPNAHWTTLGNDLQASTAATDLSVGDPCNINLDPSADPPHGMETIAGDPESDPPVYTVLPFAASVRAKRHNRCTDDQILKLVTDLLQNGGTTGAAEYMLWNGLDTWDPSLQPSLQNTDVHSVPAGANAAASVSAALVEYATLTPLDAHVVHLGLASAFELSAAGYFYSTDTDGSLALRVTGAPVVISPYYPADGVAVTPPLSVRAGVIQGIQQFEQDINITRVWGNRLLTIAFDPSTSVLVS